MGLYWLLTTITSLRSTGKIIIGCPSELARPDQVKPSFQCAMGLRLVSFPFTQAADVLGSPRLEASLARRWPPFKLPKRKQQCAALSIASAWSGRSSSVLLNISNASPGLPKFICTYDSGSTYIFERNVGGTDQWGQAAKLTASDGNRLD